MSVTTLKDTTWMFHDTINCPSFSYNIDFYCGASLARCVCLYTTSSYLRFERVNGATGSMYTISSGTWDTTNGCQVINFYGGDDEENPDFIAWIEENAEQVERDYKVQPYELLTTAKAIRKKSGSTAKIEWVQYGGYATAVNGIALGTDTTDGTAMKWDIADGVVAYSKNVRLVGTMPNAEGVSF